MNPATALANSGQSPNPVKTETARREVTLPPGLSTIEFYRAIEDLKGLIGAQHVVRNRGTHSLLFCQNVDRTTFLFRH